MFKFEIFYAAFHLIVLGEELTANSDGYFFKKILFLFSKKRSQPGTFRSALYYDIREVLIAASESVDNKPSLAQFLFKTEEGANLVLDLFESYHSTEAVTQFGSQFEEFQRQSASQIIEYLIHNIQVMLRGQTDSTNMTLDRCTHLLNTVQRKKIN